MTREELKQLAEDQKYSKELLKAYGDKFHDLAVVKISCALLKHMEMVDIMREALTVYSDAQEIGVTSRTAGKRWFSNDGCPKAKQALDRVEKLEGEL